MPAPARRPALSRTLERRVEWAFTAACLALAGGLMWRDQTTHFLLVRQAVNIDLGLWATRFILLGLTLTPLSQALRQPSLKRLRRPVGLAAAGFTLLHAVQFLAYSRVWPDYLIELLRRTYLALGVVALLLLLPLAATSFNAAIRWLGPVRWRRLHWLVYPAAIFTVLHEVWSGARLAGEVGAHAAALAALLAWRLLAWLRRIASATTGSPALNG